MPHKWTNHGITKYPTLINVDLAKYEIYHAKHCDCAFSADKPDIHLERHTHSYVTIVQTLGFEWDLGEYSVLLIN